MPPAIVAAAIPAAAGLAGSVIASRGASGAAKTQAAAGAEALQFEREREKRRQYEYDQQQEQQRAAHEAEQRRLEPFRRAAASVLAKYGIQVPIEQIDQEVAAQVSPFNSPEAPPEMMAGGPGELQPMEGGGFQPMSLGQLGEWHKWGGYGPR